MKLTEAEILRAIDAKASIAYGSDSELSNQRAQALDYYLGRPFGNEVEGRSQVVTRDVLETVEWIKPSLMEIFAAGDKVVAFEPKGPEDEAAAEQETEVLNHVILNQNDAFLTFLTWFGDALLSKTAYVKVYYDTTEHVELETYENLSEQEIAFLASDETVEIVEHWVGELGFGVKLKRVNKVGKVCITPVPPEEIRVSANVRSLNLEDCDYIEHRTKKTISELRQMGLKVEDDIDDSADETDDELATARDMYSEDDYADEHADPSMREVLFRDVTIRIDANGDGIAELKRYYIVGSTVLWEDDAENVYYAALGPIPMPHRHVGLSVADLVMDLQLLRSTLMRQYVDNLFLQNNGRYAISDRVNLDDMLVSRPGGVVRVEGEPGSAIMPLIHPSNGAAAIQGLEYLDTHKENRTGVTKYNQGLDSNSLNKTATGVNQIMNAAQQRLKLIARVFAETGVKRAFLLAHELLKKHSDKAMVLRLNNKYVEVDPRQWRTRTDMSVAVGLGTGNKQEQLQHLMMILQVQQQGIQAGITSPNHIYKAAKRLAENAGFKDGDEFFMQPQPQQQKPDPLMQKAQAELQIKQQESQMDAQNTQQKMQMEMQMKQTQMQQEMALAREKMMMEMALKREQAQMDAQLKADIAMMQPVQPVDTTYEGV